MESTIFIEISLVLVIAAVVASIMRVLKQPLIVGHIISGLILGPYVFNAIHSEEILETMSHLGITLLLFIIGLGLNPKVIKEVGKPATLIGLGQVTFTALFGFVVALALGFDSTSSIFIALALTMSSTIIILKILSDKKDTSKLYGKLSIGFLLVQDIVATLLLIFVSTSSEGGLPLADFLLVFGWLAVIGAGLVLVNHFILPRLERVFAGSQEYLFLFTIAWGLGIASLVAMAGLSIEVGALIAGIGLSTQIYAQEAATRLRPLRDFFIVLFFIVLGAGLQLDAIATALGPALVLSLFVLIGNPLIVLTIMGLLGYTKKTSFKTALTVAQISEFSLIFILLAQETGRVSAEVVSIVTIVGLITIAASTYMMLYDDKIYSWFERYLKLFERREVKYHQEKTNDADIFLFGFARGGHEFIKTFRKMKKRFLVIDYDPEAIEQLKHDDIAHEYGDITDPELLEEINIDNAKLVISTIRDYNTNLYLTDHIHQRNQDTIIIVHSETPAHAHELYGRGATYVMMPHFIGSERVSNMVNRIGLNKSDFIPSREKHLRYVRKHL